MRRVILTRAMEEAAEEDLEKQRVFYDTVRETIVSNLVAKDGSHILLDKPG